MSVTTIFQSGDERRELSIHTNVAENSFKSSCPSLRLKSSLEDIQSPLSEFLLFHRNGRDKNYTMKTTKVT